MSKIEKVFRQTRREGRAALIPYFPAGYPTAKISEEFFEALARAGADIIEIGIPFSDPLADGPTIQRASEEALTKGMTTAKVLKLVSNLRKKLDTPLLAMTYYNLVLHYGLEKFAKDAAKVGLDGVIIPDLPYDEASDWLKVAKGRLATVFLLAPTSSGKRIAKAAYYSRGFIYCVSLTGTTGARTTLPKELPAFVKKVKAKARIPVAVGFGIADAKQAREVAKIADGVIIGSALINLAQNAKTKDKQVEEVTRFIKRTKRVLAH